MSEFSKGDWYIDSLGVVRCKDEYHRSIAYLITSPATKDLDEANARLILAAPELYHMLAYMLGYVREWEAISSGTIYKAKVRSDIHRAEELLARINGKADS